MRRGLDWYKREQRAILESIRSARMTDRQAAIYNIILDLIYDGGGETPDDPKHISGYLSNVGTAAARATIQQLVDMGKVFRVGGNLHQKRAETEAKTRRKLSETRAEIGRKGGISSGNARTKSRENNDVAEANASSKREAEKEREKEEEKNTPPYPPLAAVAAAPSALVCEFDRIWPHYPRHVGVGAARKAWAKARAKASYEEIAASLRVFIPAIKGTPIDKIPHLATWLNQERWKDDHTHAVNRPRSSSEDLANIASITAADDLAAIFGALPKPYLKAIGS